MDTGVFHESRYFDIVVEYTKATTEDIAVRIEAINRGPVPAPLHILPHLWFRNTWSWGPEPLPKPVIRLGPEHPDGPCLETSDCGVATLSNIPIFYRLGRAGLDASPGGVPLFTENETNANKVFGSEQGTSKLHVKDAFHRYIVAGEMCINPDCIGTKAALHYRFDAVPPGDSATVRLRLSDRGEDRPGLSEVDTIVAVRRAEADEFYAAIHPRARATMSGESSARPWQDCCGPSRATVSTSTCGSTATIQDTLLRPQGTRSATSTGGI